MYGQIIEQLIDVLDAYENKKPILSNQGQALDGYSALANFVSLAKKARDRRNDIMGEEFKRVSELPDFIDFGRIEDVFPGPRTKFIRDTKSDREYLCIEQDGNKVWLTKLEIEHLPKLVERWRIK